MHAFGNARTADAPHDRATQPNATRAARGMLHAACCPQDQPQCAYLRPRLENLAASLRRQQTQRQSEHRSAQRARALQKVKGGNEQAAAPPPPPPQVHVGAVDCGAEPGLCEKYLPAQREKAPAGAAAGGDPPRGFNLNLHSFPRLLLLSELPRVEHFRSTAVTMITAGVHQQLEAFVARRLGGGARARLNLGLDRRLVGLLDLTGVWLSDVTGYDVASELANEDPGLLTVCLCVLGPLLQLYGLCRVWSRRRALFCGRGRGWWGRNGRQAGAPAGATGEGAQEADGAAGAGRRRRRRELVAFYEQHNPAKVDPDTWHSPLPNAHH
jgi:hypothetical protein